MPLPAPLALGFAVLALAMAAAFVAAVRFAPVSETAASRRRWTVAALAIAAVYLGTSAALAAAGVLGRLDVRPPPAGVFLAALGLGVVALAFSRLGDRLLGWPLAVLVGFQAFRVPVELLLAATHHAGALPAEMTYEGFNFDVVTGVLAVPLAVWAGRGTPPRAAVWAWNVLGTVLLATVVAIAATSAFGVVETTPRVTLPAAWPGVWLPAWLVQLALLGHLLVFRALRARP